MKKKGKESKKKVKITELLEVPSDVALGEAIITLTGKREVLIENYKGIIEYTNEFIKVSTRHGVFEIKGKNFNITYLTNEEMKITGSISEINY